MNPMTSPDELAILKKLDGLLKRDQAVKSIERAIETVSAKLAADPGAGLGWETIPLDVYGPGIPEMIQSSWVFILRSRSISGAERHPNSHQRMASYRGSGDFQICFQALFQNAARLQSDSTQLSTDPAGGLSQRWVSIPPNTWHQGVTGPEDWVVVSFQTAPERELIEERPDPADNSITHRRTYLS